MQLVVTIEVEVEEDYRDIHNREDVMSKARRIFRQATDQLNQELDEGFNVDMVNIRFED